MTPLKDAVCLTPCGHTISEIAARQIYKGWISDTNRVKEEKPCPLCRTTVTAYYPNHSVRSIVAEALGLKLEEDLPMVSKAVQADSEINIDEILFPGKSAKFVLLSGDWSLHDDDREVLLVRELCFSSSVKESLFENFSVLGDRDGKVSISISFCNHQDIAFDYLLRCGIRINSASRFLGYVFSRELGDSATKLLFRILMKHNELPADIHKHLENAVFGQRQSPGL